MIEDRIAKLTARFADCTTAEVRYETIIALGKAAVPLSARHKVPSALVPGCQSQMYLHAYLENGLVFFEAESDALIANGLAVVLTAVYSGQPAEVILKEPPTYLEELAIPASLSPGRANGLASLHLKMKQEALRLLIDKKSAEVIHRGQDLQSLK